MVWEVSGKFCWHFVLLQKISRLYYHLVLCTFVSVRYQMQEFIESIVIVKLVYSVFFLESSIFGSDDKVLLRSQNIPMVCLRKITLLNIFTVLSHNLMTSVRQIHDSIQVELFFFISKNRFRCIWQSSQKIEFFSSKELCYIHIW